MKTQTRDGYVEASGGGGIVVAVETVQLKHVVGGRGRRTRDCIFIGARVECNGPCADYEARPFFLSTDSQFGRFEAYIGRRSSERERRKGGEGV